MFRNNLTQVFNSYHNTSLDTVKTTLNTIQDYQTGAQYFLTLSAVTSIYGKAAFANAFSIVDSLSFLSSVGLVVSDYPTPELKFALGTIFQVSQFNILPYHSWEGYAFTFLDSDKDDDEIETMGDTFESLGMGSLNFLALCDSQMLTVQLYLVFWAVCVPLLIFITSCKKVKVQNERQDCWWITILTVENVKKLTFPSFVNGLILLIKQFYQTFCFAAIIHLHRIDSSLFGERLSTGYAITFIVALSAFPIILTVMWLCKHGLFTDGNDSLRKYTAHLFEGLKHPEYKKQRDPTQLWEILKLYRIGFSAFLLVYFREEPTIQLSFLTFISIIFMLAMAEWRPFKGSILMEFTKEAIQAFYCMLVFLQTDISYRSENQKQMFYERETIGKVQLAVILFALAIQTPPLLQGIYYGAKESMVGFWNSIKETAFVTWMKNRCCKKKQGVQLQSQPIISRPLTQRDPDPEPEPDNNGPNQDEATADLNNPAEQEEQKEEEHLPDIAQRTFFNPEGFVEMDIQIDDLDQDFNNEEEKKQPQDDTPNSPVSPTKYGSVLDRLMQPAVFHIQPLDLQTQPAKKKKKKQKREKSTQRSKKKNQFDAIVTVESDHEQSEKPKDAGRKSIFKQGLAQAVATFTINTAAADQSRPQLNFYNNQ